MFVTGNCQEIWQFLPGNICKNQAKKRIFDNPKVEALGTGLIDESRPLRKYSIESYRICYRILYIL